MTVTTATSRVDYTGNGVTVAFPVPFPFITDSYLVVIRTVISTGVSTTLTLDSIGADGYSVTGAGDDTGTVTVITAPTALQRLSIIRAVAGTQEADFVANDPFPAETFEDSLDKQQMQINDGATALARVPRLLDGDIDGSGRYDAKGNRIANLADGVNAQDAATVAQLSEASSASALFIQSGVGAVARTVQDRLRDSVHVKDFGAIGDGAVDDTLMVQAAIDHCSATGRALDWGDESCIYRVTAILVGVGGDAGFYWTASGATIFFDPPSDLLAVANISVTGGEYIIRGKLTIDANRKAYSGLCFRNTSDGSSESHYGDITISDLHVRNVYRSGTTFVGGDGILIRGAWNKVLLVRPDIRNVAMAAGAGVPLSQGVSGITLTNNGSAAFRYCSITDPFIDGVYSEDAAYTLDQDGIKLFDGGEDGARLYPWETFFDVRGGEFRNCWGRSIKGQANFGTVRGCKFYRDEGNSSGVGNPEIDMQVGGGSVSDIESLYIGHVPSAIFLGTGTRTAGKQTPLFRVRGVSAVITPGSAQMVSVLSFSCASTGTDSIKAIASGIDVSGADVAPCVIRMSNRSSTNLLMLSDVVADPSSEIVSLLFATGATSTTTRVLASRIVNTGADVEFITRPADPLLRIIASADDVLGTIPWGSYNSSLGLAHPAISRVDAIAPAVLYGTNGTTGLIRPVSVQINNGAEYTLPDTGFNGITGIALVSVGNGIPEQGIFAISQTGCAVLAAGASWTVGATSDPGAGNWRIWGSASGAVIKNSSGANRQVTVLMIG